MIATKYLEEHILWELCEKYPVEYEKTIKEKEAAGDEMGEEMVGQPPVKGRTEEVGGRQQAIDSSLNNC